MADERLATSDALLNRARDTGRSANTIAIAWLAALIIIWFFGIEPIDRRVEDLVGRTARAKSINKTRESTRRNLATPGKELRRRQELLEQYRTELIAIDAERLELKKKTTIPFKVPGFEVPVPPAYAPFLWSIFLLGLSAYLLRTRSTIFNAVSRAIRLRGSIGTDPETMARAVPLPWWIAPVPSRDGRVVTANDLHSTIGLREASHGSMIAVVAALALLFLLQLRMTWLALVISRRIGVARENIAIPAGAMAITVLIAFAAWRWLQFKAAVPDHHPREDEQGGISRRTALVAAGLAIIAAGMKPAQPLLDFVLRRNPRYRRWSPYELSFALAEIKPLPFLERLRRPDKIGNFLRSRLSNTTLQLLASSPEPALNAIVDDVNNVLKTIDPHQLASASPKPLSDYTKRLLQNNPSEEGVLKVNRLILCDVDHDAFPRPRRKKAYELGDVPRSFKVRLS